MSDLHEATVPADLYDTDFHAWTRAQAAALRAAGAAGVNLPIDWQNVAEEIESLGRSDRRELANRLQTIVEHLPKLQISPRLESMAHWRDAIVRSRRVARKLLADSPGLAPLVPALLGEETGAAIEDALRALEDFGELTSRLATRVQAAALTQEQVLGIGFPSSRRRQQKMPRMDEPVVF